MGRFESLVDSPSKIELFKEKYHIPQEVGLRYCSTEQIVTNREVVEVIIPIIAFIEGGMTLPIGRITRDYLINYRLCPHQCAPNMFRILGCVDALNENFQLGLTWHDVVYMYEFHSQADRGFYLKSRSAVVRLISCLPKSNKGMKDDYLMPQGHGTMVSTVQPKRERDRWDTLELGSLVKHFRSSNFHHVVIILYFALFR